MTREIFAQEAFAPFVRHEIQPGADVQSDEALDVFIKDHAYVTITAGPVNGDVNDPMPKDPDRRDCQYVADSSIFPQITNGN